ncbi:MAG TPA: HutP family protein [Bacillota bacterium]|mgnify:CR=1 FL=1|nr:HutP family protein [Bacillota bacterium]HPE38803.1 HutP family protein [Bacillota bacterium]
MKEIIANSKLTASSAIRIALTNTREDETLLKAELLKDNIHATACDFGGEFISSVSKIIERTVVAAQREGIIGNGHNEEGALAGAAREAVSQISSKAIGLNVGGKIGIARYNDHISVCVFFGIGLLHLNEIAIGLGHRAI